MQHVGADEMSVWRPAQPLPRSSDRTGQVGSNPDVAFETPVQIDRARDSRSTPRIENAPTSAHEPVHRRVVTEVSLDEPRPVFAVAAFGFCIIHPAHFHPKLLAVWETPASASTKSGIPRGSGTSSRRLRRELPEEMSPVPSTSISSKVSSPPSRGSTNQPCKLRCIAVLPTFCTLRRSGGPPRDQ